MWCYETLHSDVKFGLKGKILYKKKTAHQNCLISKTKDFGKVLFLDNVIQTTEADEYIYHEMLVHPLLLTHPNPESILVIGGGDGGVIREILKHPVKELIMVEIDKTIIDLSKKYLPKISKGSFSDKRLGLIIDDGAKYIQETPKKFDLIIVDSPDPVGPAKMLFSKKFYQDVYKRLKSSGIMIRQTGSTFLQANVLKSNYRKIKDVFPLSFIQLASIPTYTGGYFSFVIGSKKINFLKKSKKQIKQKYLKLKLKTKYYNPGIQFAALQLPNNLLRLVK
ncbi:MAG: polyamine aminopropyltransferase [Candidatus Omnitrophica bacterium]|nr:polyamine aminopropyltransferase [Candidatus Omnitrophota bacterium]MCF7894252.1 polyamine aminopropyltransferase [Candidatus Omnitrophota bacterium]